nr:hypothetical protein [Gordonia phthalatica]
MSSPWKRMRTGQHRAHRGRRRAAAAVIAASATLAGGLATAAPAAAAPYGAKYVKTIRCDSPSPWPAGPLRIFVDVFTDVPFPSDGLPGPAIALSANNPGGSGPILELTTLTTVRWTNRTTGRSGVVRVPTRAHSANWDAVIHPGHGAVSFTIHQKIGALAFVPMVNPQYTTCRGSATA